MRPKHETVELIGGYMDGEIVSVQNGTENLDIPKAGKRGWDRLRYVRSTKDRSKFHYQKVIQCSLTK